MLSYFNIRNLRNTDIVGARNKRYEYGSDVFWWFRTNVVSQLADRLKIRTNRIMSEFAEVTSELAEVTCFITHPPKSVIRQP